MKPLRTISRGRRRAGILLTECLVYIAVFSILLGIGTAAFYFCWDHTRAVIYDTEDIAAALRTGELWRADVRTATGKISVEVTATGEVVRIPEAGKQIAYRFEAGELRRETSLPGNSRLLLPKVKMSENETGNPRRCARVALGTGIDAATERIPNAVAVHV